MTRPRPPRPAIPPPPRHLSAEARALWRKVHEGWVLDAAAVPIFVSALEALDRVRAAREVLAREGLVVRGARGPRAHPLLAVERDARLQFLRAWRQLRLDEEPPGPIGRPPGR